MRQRFVERVVLLVGFQAVLLAQVAVPPQQPTTQQQPLVPQQLGQAPAVTTPPTQQALEGGNQFQQLRSNYVLRAGDQILIRAFEVDEISERPFRVDGDGFINLPILGRIQAGGVSLEGLEAVLVQALKKFVRQPQVTVTVVQFSSEPVFFVGAFRSPGIYPLAGRRTLLEMISSIGGLQPTASRRIKVSRRKEYGAIPLPNTIAASDGSGTSIEITMASLRENVNPAEDIILQPFDSISVEQAEKVYVTGDVGRTGALDLQERDSISVIQALTLAGGVGPQANTKYAWILRPVMNTSRRAEIPLNIARILKGEDVDKPLLPNDVLYVQRSSVFSAKNVARTLLIIIPVATGLSYALTR